MITAKTYIYQYEKLKVLKGLNLYSKKEILYLLLDPQERKNFSS